MSVVKKTAPQNASLACKADQAELQDFTGKAAVQIQRAVINHKVEQVIRALYIGLETQNVSCAVGTAHENFHALDWKVIGVADHKGYRFTPDTNTRLIMMGLHPTSVLASLTRMRFNGEPVVAVHGNLLVALHGAVAQNARDQVFNTKPLLDLYLGLAKPQLFT